MPTVYVNDKPVEIGTQKLNCIQAARAGRRVHPALLLAPALTVVASCRMCLVEVGDLKDGKLTMQPKVVPGCQTPVKDGTVIVTGEYDKRDPPLPALPYDPATYKAARRRASQEGPGRHARRAAAQSSARLPGLRQGRRVLAAGLQLQLRPLRDADDRREEHAAEQAGPRRARSRCSPTAASCARAACASPARSAARPSCMVINRGHHAEIDIFPGEPLDNKLAGNVVDLCPVGALGSQGLPLQAARLVPEDDRRRLLAVAAPAAASTSIPTRTSSTACGRGEPAGAGLLHVRRGPVRLPLRQLDRTLHAAARARRDGSSLARCRGRDLLPRLRQAFADAAQANAGGVVAVLSPFLTCRGSVPARQVLQGAVDGRAARARAGAGGRRGRHVPEGRAGNAGRAGEVHHPRREVPEPPRRRGGAASTSRARSMSVRRRRCSSRSTARLVRGRLSRPRSSSRQRDAGASWKAPAAAGGAGPVRTPARPRRPSIVLPATSVVREGRHVRQPRRAGPDVRRGGAAAGEVRTDGNWRSTCSAAAGWCKRPTVRAELAAAMPEFAKLAEKAVPADWHAIRAGRPCEAVPPASPWGSRRANCGGTHSRDFNDRDRSCSIYDATHTAIVIVAVIGVRAWARART